MAPFVPRERKHRKRQRAKNEGSAANGANSNVLEILPASIEEKEKKKTVLRETLRAEQPGMSRKRQKRLEKYIDKKLRKEENLDLIKKLASARFDTSLLRSSRDLGVIKESKRTVLSRALKERQAGVNLRGDEFLLSGDRVTGTGHSDTDSDASSDSDARRLQRSTPNVIVPLGRGLKRSLETDDDGRPMIKRRSRIKGHKQIPITSDDLPWDGFSSAEDFNGSGKSSVSGNMSTGTQTDSEEEISGPESASDQEQIQDDSMVRNGRSSAFKAWATQQVNEAMGFKPTCTDVGPQWTEASKIITNFKPREPESEPLPPELKTDSIALDRIAYSTKVERNTDIQAARMLLPVVAEEQKIMEAIFNNPCVVIWGTTGSGKTTQIPQFLYEAGFGDPKGPTPGMVGVTQPRRVAAVSMSKRVSDELGGLPNKVSYQIRYESSVSSQTAIKFMTDGILVREIANDFALLKYSVVIIDEAHERSTNTDILIGMVSRIVDLRRDMNKEDPKVTPLKLVIMSATLRVSDFLENTNLFRNGPPPLVQAEGRQFPVTVHFSRRTQRDYLEETFQKVSKGHKKLPPGGMLVFLTGQNEINALSKRLKENFVNTKASNSTSKKITISASDVPLEAEDLDLGGEVARTHRDLSNQADCFSDGGDDDDEFAIEPDGDHTSISSQIHVLPLYSQLQTKDQMLVFEPVPDNARLIVLATNVAETSLTIPGIRYVFDTGRAKERRYDQVTGVQSFEIDWISKASASQRAGRAGRTGPGHCYRLYSSAVYERDFQEYTEPEILRMPVEGIVLQLKSMDLQHVINFPFPTPPDRHSLAKAEKLLAYLGAISTHGKITPVGRELSAYPLSPRFSKMLVIGHQHACMPYTIAMVSALAVQDLFVPENQLDLSACIQNAGIIYTTADRLEDESRERRKKEFHKAHSVFSKNSVSSDAIKALTALCAYAYASDHDKFAQEYFLSPKAAKEASALRHQLSTIVQNNQPGVLPSKFQNRLPQPSSKQLKAVEQILAAAFIDQVAIRADLAPTAEEAPRKPSRATDVPYLPLFKTHQGKAEDIVEIAVFIHPSSVLASLAPRELPHYLIYSHLQRSSPASVEGARKPRTRMHALVSVTGKQLLALARGTPLLEYGKPIGKVTEVDGGKRECWVVPEMVGEKGGRRWPLPAQKVLQRKETKEGWVVDQIL
ncbi:MAG: hypothetical protein Q9195_007576 [Heterodermia aff. obscurata]